MSTGWPQNQEDLRSYSSAADDDSLPGAWTTGTRVGTGGGFGTEHPSGPLPVANSRPASRRGRLGRRRADDDEAPWADGGQAGDADYDWIRYLGAAGPAQEPAAERPSAAARPGLPVRRPAAGQQGPAAQARGGQARPAARPAGPPGATGDALAAAQYGSAAGLDQDRARRPSRGARHAGPRSAEQVGFEEGQRGAYRPEARHAGPTQLDDLDRGQAAPSRPPSDRVARTGRPRHAAPWRTEDPDDGLAQTDPRYGWPGADQSHLRPPQASRAPARPREWQTDPPEFERPSRGQGPAGSATGPGVAPARRSGADQWLARSAATLGTADLAQRRAPGGSADSDPRAGGSGAGRSRPDDQADDRPQAKKGGRARFGRKNRAARRAEQDDTRRPGVTGPSRAGIAGDEGEPGDAMPALPTRSVPSAWPAGATGPMPLAQQTSQARPSGLTASLPPVRSAALAEPATSALHAPTAQPLPTTRPSPLARPTAAAGLAPATRPVAPAGFAQTAGSTAPAGLAPAARPTSQAAPAPAAPARPAPATRRSATKARKRRSARRRIGLLAVAVILIAAGGGVGYRMLRADSGPAHVVSTPQRLLSYVQQSALAKEMGAQQLRSEIIAKGHGEASHVVDAVYENSNAKSPLIILFIGGNLSGSASSFMSSFTGMLPGSFGVSPGSLGGQAACVPSFSGHPAECAWADDDTFGMIASPTLSATALAAQLREIRPLVEHRVR
jgi:hypothetical protein